jgi:hypothetical protein
VIPNACWFLWQTTITFPGVGSAGLGEAPPLRPHPVSRRGITTPWP